MKPLGSVLADTFHTCVEATLDFVYPSVCIGCGDWLKKGDRSVCGPCLLRIERIREPICRKCGRQLEYRTGRTVACPDCRAYHYTFQLCRSLAVYRGLAETMIHHLKYRGKRSLGTLLGGMMAARLVELKQYEPLEVIVPVPLHPRRKKTRGYNQSAVLASAMGKVLSRPVDPHGLVRTRNNDPQVDLDGPARWSNTAGCFAVGEGRNYEDRVVLLVDDVMTSGATIQA
ncbi:double zinc ribbon domain-containing protein, partial [candidate division KSB1 bacterium]